MENNTETVYAYVLRQFHRVNQPLTDKNRYEKRIQRVLAESHRALCPLLRRSQRRSVVTDKFQREAAEGGDQQSGR